MHSSLNCTGSWWSLERAELQWWVVMSNFEVKWAWKSEELENLVTKHRDGQCPISDLSRQSRWRRLSLGNTNKNLEVLLCQIVFHRVANYYNKTKRQLGTSLTGQTLKRGRRVRVWPTRPAWHHWEECIVPGALVQGCTAGQTHFNLIGWVALHITIQGKWVETGRLVVRTS